MSVTFGVPGSPTVRDGGRRPKTPTLLSIDFDFWIPCRQELEPFTAEQGGQKDIEQWKRRVVTAVGSGIDLRSAINLHAREPSPLGIAKTLDFDPHGVGVMDQHVFAYDHFADVKDAWLVHVDAHHDMGYAETDGLHCGNWVQRLVEQGQVKRVTLIYPMWRRSRLYSPQNERAATIQQKNLAALVEVRHGLHHLPRKMRFKKTALCRSGAWTPPWLDTTFEEFVKTFGDKATAYEPTPVREFSYERCVQDFERLLRRKHVLRKAIEELKGFHF